MLNGLREFEEANSIKCEAAYCSTHTSGIVHIADVWPCRILGLSMSQVVCQPEASCGVRDTLNTSLTVSGLSEQFAGANNSSGHFLFERLYHVWA